MSNLIVSAVLLLAAVGLAGAARAQHVIAKDESAPEYRQKNAAKAASAIGVAWKLAFVVALATAGLSAFYAQDAGDVVVLRSLGGRVVGHTSEAGFHAKAPWDAAVAYDVRNNVVTFYGSGTPYAYEGGSANGPQVTINDSGGATADIDIQVNYSLSPKYAEDLYADYGTQEAFVKSVVSVDCRSVPREVAGKFTTMQILTSRSELADAIQDALSKKWEKYGITVEDVSVQDVRYPEEITQSYADAQAAEVKKQQAQHEQETAKVEAETKAIEAQGEAEANRILAESLNEQVLTQQYYETLKSVGKNGNLVVVPEGSQPIVQTQSGE